MYMKNLPLNSSTLVKKGDCKIFLVQNKYLSLGYRLIVCVCYNIACLFEPRFWRIVLACFSISVAYMRETCFFTSAAGENLIVGSCRSGCFCMLLFFIFCGLIHVKHWIYMCIMCILYLNVWLCIWLVTKNLTFMLIFFCLNFLDEWLSLYLHSD